MASSFLKKFRRITDSTSYLPEIDGLRFLAIFSVVIILHITGFVNDKFYEGQFVTSTYWHNIILGGGNGVAFFFIISGFILSLPFAKWRLNDQKPVSLKRYYLRRLTRLEPPYLIALLIFFAAHVWILKSFTFQYLWPHLLASAVYVHTFLFHSFSPILPVAWSLEVEVQFYLIAPLIFLMFLIRKSWLRRGLYLLVIAVNTVYWFDNWTTPHVFKFLHCFFIGILLADLYCSKKVVVKNEDAGFVIGLLSLAGYIFLPTIGNFTGYLLHILCMFFLFHSVLCNAAMKKIFSGEMITVIGGMCYTIYLLHFAIISFTGRLLQKLGVQADSVYFFLPLALCLALAVLAVSAVYFRLVERPFMNPIRFSSK